MEVYKEIKAFFVRHGYLLIIAAWLLTLAFLINNYLVYISSPQGVQLSMEQSIRYRESKFNQFIRNKPLMDQLVNRTYDASTLDQLSGGNNDVYLFVFHGNWETFWSSDQIDINSEIRNLADGVYFKKFKNGYFEIIKRELPGSYGQDFVIGAIPIKEQYYYDNPYLPDEFYKLSKISSQYQVNTKGIGLPIRNMDGLTLFFLKYNDRGEGPPSAWISGILKALATFCVLLFLNLFFVQVGKKSHPGMGFLLWLLLLLFLRSLSYHYSFPFNYGSFRLFDPTIYASSDVLRSLGDLLINVLLVFWVILYFRTEVLSEIVRLKLNRFLSLLLGVVLCLSAYVAASFIGALIQGLIINSKISFDVTDYTGLTVYSVIGLFILSLLILCFYFGSLILNRLLDSCFPEGQKLKLGVLCGVGLIWLAFVSWHHAQFSSLIYMIWVILYFILLDNFDFHTDNQYNPVYYLLWLIFLTSSVTAILVHFNKSRELASRLQLAMRLSKQKDPLLEFNLSMINQELQRDTLISDYLRIHQFPSKTDVPVYVLNRYFNNLRNKYDIQFDAFDSNGNPLNARDTLTQSKLLLKLDQAKAISTVPDLYYSESSFSHYAYSTLLPMEDSVSRQQLGWLYYRLQPKAVKQETLYPELLMSSEDYQFENALNKYAYAEYDNLRLVSHHNQFPFPIQISMAQIPLGDYMVEKDGAYSELWYKPSEGKLIVLVSQGHTWIETLTLFAYLFLALILLTLFYRLGQVIIKTRLNLAALRKEFHATIRTKIQVIVILVMVFSFIILGAVTISFFIARYDKQHREKLADELAILSANVQKMFEKDLHGDAIQEFYQPAFQMRLRKDIQDIADTYGVDLNIFDLDGNLKVSTQNILYENGLMSYKMDPRAYYKLQYQKQIQVIQKEHVGHLAYLSSYVPIRDAQGETVAFLNRPYFASQADLNQEISSFLVTLINLNAFIFLISGLLALLLSNSITRSFTLISEKLKLLSLNQHNEEIQWMQDDEIGLLVNEYNKMVRKLEISAAMLAKSEREGAWREMARQVAHEIKNPLTPMKLNLQYLRKAIENKADNIPQLTEQVTQTLIEQIEHLAQIASDFSAFANISNANYEKILLNEIVQSVVGLYQGYERATVSFDPPATEFWIFADKTQMNRLFNNLILNAIQATPPGREAIVHIHMEVADAMSVLVKITDNGSGIPDELHSRIFIPNFTTKSSGTGLGLAMCKNILEKAGGEIWFETVQQMGTTFYVLLPLYYPS